MEIAEVYRESLRQVSGSILPQDMAKEEKGIKESEDSSLKELLIIKRQRKYIVEDMNDKISRHKVEDVYT